MVRCTLVAKVTWRCVRKQVRKCRNMKRHCETQEKRAQEGVTSPSTEDLQATPSLPIEFEVAAEIGQALRQIRIQNENESRLAASIDIIGDKVIDLHNATSILQSRLRDIDVMSSRAARIAAERMLQDIALMREWITKLETEQYRLTQALNENQAIEQQERVKIVKTIQSVFIAHGLLHDVTATGQPMESETSALLEELQSVQMPSAGQYNENGKEQGSSSYQSIEALMGDGAVEVERDRDLQSRNMEHLKRDYYILQSFLKQAEANLAGRHERLDQERDEFKKSLINGNNSVSQLTFDMYQLMETHRLTRDVIEAEIEFSEAKAKAATAGCNVQDSVQSSGFVDDVDDGYRISFERDVEESMDWDAVLTWLGDVRDIAEGEELGSEFEAEMFGAVDEWDARCVGIEDSRSLVAEGSERRRIDRWRDLMARLQQDK